MTRYLPLMSVIAGIVFGAPTLTLAAPISAHNYGLFALTDTQKAAMTTDADRACETRAARTPNDLSVLIACYDNQAARSEMRIETAYLRARTRLAPAKRQRLRADQRNWVQNGFTPCENRWSAELNIQSSAYGLAIAKCNAEEWHRRAVWIEQYR